MTLFSHWMHGWAQRSRFSLIKPSCRLSVSMAVGLQLISTPYIDSSKVLLKTIFRNPALYLQCRSQETHSLSYSPPYTKSVSPRTHRVSKSWEELVVIDSRLNSRKCSRISFIWYCPLYGRRDSIYLEVCLDIQILATFLLLSTCSLTIASQATMVCAEDHVHCNSILRSHISCVGFVYSGNERHTY